MKLKNLQSLLEGFEGPPNPDINLEQYQTPAKIAAELIFNASTKYDDIKDKVVVDLGCGTGILSIACLIMGAREVHAYDIDIESINAAKRNLTLLEFEEEPPIFFHNCDVLNIENVEADTVVMNPPFGTRNKGIDLKFLTKAFSIAKRAIYSFHKTSTRKHVLEIAAPKIGLQGELLQAINFDLKKLYKFQKKDVKAIEVDIYRFTRNE